MVIANPRLTWLPKWTLESRWNDCKIVPGKKCVRLFFQEDKRIKTKLAHISEVYTIFCGIIWLPLWLLQNCNDVVENVIRVNVYLNIIVWIFGCYNVRIIWQPFCIALHWIPLNSVALFHFYKLSFMIIMMSAFSMDAYHCWKGAAFYFSRLKSVKTQLNFTTRFFHRHSFSSLVVFTHFLHLYSHCHSHHRNHGHYIHHKV